MTPTSGGPGSNGQSPPDGSIGLDWPWRTWRPATFPNWKSSVCAAGSPSRKATPRPNERHSKKHSPRIPAISPRSSAWQKLAFRNGEPDLARAASSPQVKA